MPLIVNTNVTSMNAQRHLGVNTNALNKSMERLASGFRINRAGDDAAGLQLSENLRAQIKGAKKAYDNVQDGINVLNIADGAMQSMQNNLQRVRELLVQAANDTYAAPQRAALVQEIENLLQENDRIAETTTFNGVNLLNANVPQAYDPGTNSEGFWLQIGPNSDQPTPANPNLNRIDISSALVDLNSQTNYAPDPDPPYQAAMQVIFDGTNIRTSGNGGPPATPAAADGIIENNTEAQEIISEIDNAMAEINSRRGALGAIVNRLEGTAQNLQISIENISASESRIRNVDVAAESAELVRNQILQQSSATILSQANQVPSLALQLLQG